MNQAIVGKSLAQKVSAILIVLAASTCTSALADDTASPASPSEKKDEEKATMPPDVTTPKLQDTTKAIEQKTQTAVDTSQPAKGRFKKNSKKCKTAK